MLFKTLAFCVVIATSGASAAEPRGTAAEEMARELVEHIRLNGKGDTEGYGPHWNDGREPAWAAIRLQGLGYPAVPILIQSVDDKDAWVQMWALETLGRMKAREAGPAIAHQLECSGDAAVLAAAANAARRIRVRQATPGLLRAAQLEPDFFDRPLGSSAEALGVLRDPAAVPVLGAMLDANVPPPPQGHFWSADPRVAHALAQFGTQALPFLARALVSSNRYAPAAAFQALAEMDHPEAFPIIAKAATRVSKYDRELMAQAMANTRDRRSIPYLIGLLKDEDSPVRAFAAYGLGRKNAKEALPALRKALLDEFARAKRGEQMSFLTSETAPFILAALCAMRDRAAVPLIEDAFSRQKDPDMRGYLAVAFAHIERRAAIPKLIQLLSKVEREHAKPDANGHEPQVIDINYAVALARIGPDGVAATVRALNEGRITDEQASLVLRVLYLAFDRVIDFADSLVGRRRTVAERQAILRPALGWLDHPDGPARSELLMCLMDTPLEEARGRLREIIENPRDPDRWSAIDALQALRDPAAIQPTIDHILKSTVLGDWSESEADTLGALGKAAAQPILQALPKASSKARKVLLLALAQTKAPVALPYFIAALSEADPDVVRTAAKGLRLIGNREAKGALGKLRSSPDIHVRWEAFLALCDAESRPKDPPRRPYNQWQPGTWFKADEHVGT